MKLLKALLLLLGLATILVFAYLLWRGDAEMGRRIVENNCGVCHDLTLTRKNIKGPYLWGLVGRPAGSAEGFAYSDAFLSMAREKSLVWTPENIDKFMTHPDSFIPNSKMTEKKKTHIISFDGIDSEANRRDLIAFLKTLK
ncbi:MAG: c-type cytochrome [Magnetococcales bacterium]|nr:c-type cytochrome [Magnetococcales bacterium]